MSDFKAKMHQIRFWPLLLREGRGRERKEGESTGGKGRGWEGEEGREGEARGGKGDPERPPSSKFATTPLSMNSNEWV